MTLGLVVVTFPLTVSTVLHRDLQKPRNQKPNQVIESILDNCLQFSGSNLVASRRNTQTFLQEICKKVSVECWVVQMTLFAQMLALGLNDPLKRRLASGPTLQLVTRGGSRGLGFTLDCYVCIYD